MPRQSKIDIEPVDGLILLMDRGIDINRRVLFFGSTDSPEGNDTLDSFGASHFLKGLHFLNTTGKRPIKVVMNCAGGDWLDGMAMYDAIRQSNAPVDVYVVGSALSMGALMMQGARKRYASEHSTILVHDGYVGGQTDRVTMRSGESWTARLKTCRGTAYDIFGKRTKKPASHWEKVSSNDTVFTAQQALELGLIDEIKLPVPF